MRLLLCAWILGILVLQAAPRLVPLSALEGASLVWALGVGALRHWPRGRSMLLFLALFLGGLVMANERARLRMAHRLPPRWEHQNLTLTGTLISLPEGRAGALHFKVAADPGSLLFPAEVALSEFALPLHDAPAELHPGQRWRWQCRVKSPHGQVNPGGFDSATWAWSEGILTQGSIDRRTPPVFLGWSHPGGIRGLHLFIEAQRDLLRQRLRRQLKDQPWGPVLIALVIGDQSTISPADWQLFWATGVGHLISISGLHITMLAGLVAKVTGLLSPSLRIRWLAGWLGASAYALIAGFSLPTQRTLAMITVLTLARFQKRPLPPSTLLLLAAALTLTGDPFASLSPSFWLSFGAVSWMVYAGAHQTGRLPFWKQEIHSQWAATWAMVPLLIWLFGQVSWISPLANAFAIPLVSLGVVPLALLGLIPGLGFCLKMAHALMTGTAWGLDWLVRHSGPPLALPTPTLPVLIVATLGVGFLLAPRGIPGRWAGCLGLLGLVVSPLPRPDPGGLWLDLLDVGQGLAVVLRTARHTLVVDTGPRVSSEQDAGERVVIPALRSFGVRQLDGLLLSHGDLDHSGGLHSLVSAYPVPWILSPLPASHPLLHGIPHTRTCVAGMHWNWEGVDFEILYPDPEDLSDPTLKSNDRACVLRLTVGRLHVLLPADIEARSEQALLERSPEKLQADVLIVPHHGSKTSSTPAFLQAVAPRWSLFSVGDHNRFKHPNPVVWMRYGEAHSERLRTDQCGALELHMADHQIQGTVLRAVFPHYWESRCPETEPKAPPLEGPH
ncbi:MAG: DNA internalization-related competence protein ComEC/Rec2 [Ferrovum myxofaciens]|uniref:DNA internalization-related competence protein ComEC/Rec2 n=1 Tax=Ferrovum myxofaciens TaxID=416213 RepID=UPI00235411CD|nr:DNA internalization-related competence protein ComEC/Rec2 [Ferrovum myxofaciens]QKE40907.1 MAG: DNA internalization-related competence protein ComEC/Rec2 [Ferrovum myxofaciens]